MSFVIQNPGEAMYAIHDSKTNGWLTWDERGNRGILMFTTAEAAEEYIEDIDFKDSWTVCKIMKRKAQDFVKQMVHLGITIALIDVPPKHETDPLAPWEVTRNYAIVPLTEDTARMMAQWD